jgi:hypothetical protein
MYGLMKGNKLKRGGRMGKLVSMLSLAAASGFAGGLAYPSGLTGAWEFDDTNDLLHAETGIDLQLNGTLSVVPGPMPGDGAIEIGRESYFECMHNMAPNGGSSDWVNNYTVLMDVRISSTAIWHALIQTSLAPEDSDADLFIRTTGKVGVGAIGYSDETLHTDVWCRLVASVSLGTNETSHFDIYLDGNLIRRGTRQDSNGRFAIRSTANGGKVLFFADNSGEDGRIDVARIAIFNRDLTALEVAEMGGVETSGATGVSAWVPRVRFLDPHSAAVEWESDSATDAIVEYGTTKSLGKRAASSTNGTAHCVVLPGLQWRTKYWYRIGHADGSGEVFSPIYWFDNAINFSGMDASEVPSPWTTDGMTATYAGSASHILEASGIDRGYVLVYGIGDGRLLFELARQSDLTVLAVDDNAPAVASARQKLLEAGLYGTRVKVRFESNLSALPYTKDFFNLIVSGRAISDGTLAGSGAEALRMVRPDGGHILMGATSAIDSPTIQNWFSDGGMSVAPVSDSNGTWGDYLRAALANVGWWTHEYGSPANNGYAGDDMGGATATTDLQLQWLGRPGSDSGIDRNPRMPSPVSANGRLYHQGYNRVMAMDSYNGAMLWSLEIPALRRVNIPRDTSNMCADSNSVYLAIRNECWRLDGKTGELLHRYGISEDAQEWGALFRYNDLLIGSVVPKRAHYLEFMGPAFWYDNKDGTLADKVCSKSVFALDAATGSLAWGYTNGVVVETTLCMGGNRVYFLESRNAENVALGGGRFGPELWRDLYLVALDSNTGALLWEQPVSPVPGIAVVSMMYAPVDDKVILSTSKTDYNLYVYNAGNGTAAWQATGQAWFSDNHSGHLQRPVVVNDKVFLVPKLFRVSDGTVLNPSIGNLRSGCPTYAASTHALIYRGTGRKMALQDLDTGVLTSWNYLRPSCWLNFSAAGGMFLMPEGGGGCSCNGWINTSLGFSSKE